MSPTSAGGARIPKQAASISPASLKRQEEVLPMAKLEQRRYKDVHKYFYLTEKSVDCKCSQQIFLLLENPWLDQGFRKALAMSF